MKVSATSLFRSLVAAVIVAVSGCAAPPAIDGAPSLDAPVAAAPTAPVDATAPRTTHEPNHDCWFVDRTDGHLMTVWVSPRLPGEVPGGFRFVTLSLHVPNVRGGILLGSRPARCDSNEVVGLRAGPRSMQVVPAAGRTWRTVVGPADLDVRVGDGHEVRTLSGVHNRSPARDRVAK